MEIINFTPFPALVGGMIIGLAAAMLLLSVNKIFGISGIVSCLLSLNKNDSFWRILIILGLIIGAAFGHWVFATPKVENFRSYPYLVIGSIIMGFGTRYGGGCTSGHGVCGIARLSKRSIIATLVFITTGSITVLVMRLLEIGK
ncbi:MAG: YeeE/YedE family protein [Bacteriovoracaceae bacterium]|jgi:uncharacterized protein|nr:YeeE/YedE family protein [Bacteriovoracaceae bacterium]